MADKKVPQGFDTRQTVSILAPKPANIISRIFNGLIAKWKNNQTRLQGPYFGEPISYREPTLAELVKWREDCNNFPKTPWWVVLLQKTHR
jgi:hypothetical protein